MTSELTDRYGATFERDDQCNVEFGTVFSCAFPA